MIVAIVGLITALGAATIALVSTDLKRILAYSTVSHLGLMMLSLGAFGWTAAVFHLMAHGFAKALLFLGAGSVMHGVGAHGDVDIRRVGGLRRAMPVTAIAFSIGALSLGGIPILSGFWSKDEILLAVEHNLPVIFIVLTMLTAFLSALYMARAMFVVFFGPEGEDSHHAHESPLLMTGVLSVLAVLAVGFGWIAFNWPGNFDGFGSFVFYDHAEKFHFGPVLGAISIILAVGAFVLAWLVYVRRSVSHEPWRARFAGILRVVERQVLRGRGVPVGYRPGGADRFRGPGILRPRGGQRRRHQRTGRRRAQGRSRAAAARHRTRLYLCPRGGLGRNRPGDLLVAPVSLGFAATLCECSCPGATSSFLRKRESRPSLLNRILDSGFRRNDGRYIR